VRNTFLFAVLIFPLIGSVSLPCCAQNPIEPVEYEVMGDLIRRSDQGDDQTVRIVLQNLTTQDSIEGLALKTLKRKLSLTDELIEDFNRRNASAFALENLFNLKADLYLLRNEEVKEIFNSSYTQEEFIEEKDWEEFRKRYRTYSIDSISRPGFNRQHSLALVEMGSQYGYLAGTGYYYLLAKTRNGWKIRGKTMAWIS
jgi:hypothetical protein